jgi:5-methylthioribose kinase
MANPSNLDLFNFDSWAKHKDPGHRWRFEPLSGGLVNVVVRATHVESTSEHLSVFHPYETVILKYAPPFIASIGPAAPFSEFRQVIESRALNLLENKFQPPGAVRFPKLLDFDTHSHVLVIEDLGDNLVTLDKWLTSRPAEDAVKVAATELGIFLAHLHTATELATDQRSFESSESRQMISCQIVENIHGHLRDWGVRDAERLSEVVREAYVSSSIPNDQLGFQVGDLWPGSVLVSSDGQKVAVIDWEFAGPGRPLGDMAQLGE